MFENYSLWDKLKNNHRPIFMYGTGNGGDKIFAALEKHGISLTGIFASDGFVRDRCFHEYKVKSYSDVISEYGNDITVLLAFGTTLPQVYEFIEMLDWHHELIIPDVPLYGGELFDYDYFIKNKNRIKAVRELFFDERSKEIFCDLINFRLTGKLEYLRNTEEIEDTLSELFYDTKFGTIVDCGAFKGDSTKIFSDVLKPEKIIAVEADPKTFLKLEKYREQEANSNVETINAAIWSEDGILEYTSSASRGSGEAGHNKRAKIKKIVSRSLDSLLISEDVDFLKLDIEGAEAQALTGGRNTLKRCAPSLSVSLYHKTDDIFDLTESVHASLPQHKLYLRRIPCIPFWDLNLYAIK